MESNKLMVIGAKAASYFYCLFLRTQPENECLHQCLFIGLLKFINSTLSEQDDDSCYDVLLEFY
jgi:hypothetical protein